MGAPQRPAAGGAVHAPERPVPTRQRPDAPGPRERHAQQATNPAPPAGLADGRSAGAHGIPLAALGREALAAAAFDSLSAAEQQRPGRGTGRPQEPPQDAADREAGPTGPVADPLVALPTLGLLQAPHPSGDRHRLPTGSEHGTDDEHESVRPDATADEWRGRRQQG
jgi:hypothetical protein